MATPSNMSQTVFATYSTTRLIAVPLGLDLNNTSVVSNWWVKWDTLFIRFADGRLKKIAASLDKNDKLDSGYFLGSPEKVVLVVDHLEEHEIESLEDAQMEDVTDLDLERWRCYGLKAIDCNPEANEY